MHSDHTTRSAYAVAGGEGIHISYGGALHTVKATAEQTNGAFGLVEIICPAGFVAPMHRHHLEDESFYVLEGEVMFFLEDERIVVGAGGFAFLPRGHAHGFQITSQCPLRAISMFTPGGFEAFFEDVGEVVQSPMMPAAIIRDLDRIRAAGKRFNFDDLGPLP
jgi:quercetin dioxygenase-like cupin family protein